MIKQEIDAVIKKSTMNQTGLAFIQSKVIELVNKKVQGDIVECGVWMGGTSAKIAQMLLEYKDDRVIRLFDSFDDICEPLPLDGARLIKQVGGSKNAQGRLQPVKGFYRKRKLSGPGNAKYVYNLMTKVVGYPKNRVKIYKGWFQHTLAPYSKRIDKIALLMLDCDLYVSIKICLEHLYKKLVPGGIIIIDDYYYYDGAKLAVDEYIKDYKVNVTIPKLGKYVCWTKQ